MSTPLTSLIRGQSWQTMHPVPFATLPASPTILDRMYIGLKERITIAGWLPRFIPETEFELVFATGTRYESIKVGLNEGWNTFGIYWWSFIVELQSLADTLASVAGWNNWVDTMRHAKNWDGIGGPDYYYTPDPLTGYAGRGEMIDFWIFDDIQQVLEYFDDNYVP